MRDLTCNKNLHDNLVADRTWWCQRVDHEFEYGNHVKHVPIKSTYQIKLSVAHLKKHSASPGTLNSLVIGDRIAVRLPITTRCAEEMISLDLHGSENYEAFMVQPPTNSLSNSSTEDLSNTTLHRGNCLCR